MPWRDSRHWLAGNRCRLSAVGFSPKSCHRKRWDNKSDGKNLSFHNPSTQPAALAAPFFYNLRRSRHHHPRAKGPSNLRTLRPIGPVNPKNLPFRTLSATGASKERSPSCPSIFLPECSVIFQNWPQKTTFKGSSFSDPGPEAPIQNGAT